MEKAYEYYSKAASLGNKLAKEILASQGKTHLQSTYVEEKENLKKSQIGKFCEDNLIKSERYDVYEKALPSVKKNKEKDAFINSIVASGLPKEFVEKANFNPQEFDFYKREENMNMYRNDYNYNNQSERNDLNLSYENQKLIESHPHKQHKKIPQLN